MRHTARIRIFCLLLIGLAAGGCALLPAREPAYSNTAARAAEQAAQMVGKPYRYGGNNPKGFDCSGLVHYSYARAGVAVPRSTEAQRRNAATIRPERVRPGDLLFFNIDRKNALHVAIYLGHDRFVHAPSTGKRVNTASLANGYWRERFIGAGRFPLE